MPETKSGEFITVTLTMMVSDLNGHHFSGSLFDFTAQLIEDGIDYVETTSLHNGGFNVETSTERKARTVENDPVMAVKSLVEKRKGREISAEQFGKITQAIVSQNQQKKLTPSKSSEDALAQLKERMKKRGK
jgi:hypothetical protein